MSQKVKNLAEVKWQLFGVIKAGYECVQLYKCIAPLKELFWWCFMLPYLLTQCRIAYRKEFRFISKIVKSVQSKLDDAVLFPPPEIIFCCLPQDLLSRSCCSWFSREFRGREEDGLSSYLFNLLLMSLYGPSLIKRFFPNMKYFVPKCSQILKSIKILCTHYTPSIFSVDRKCICWLLCLFWLYFHYH